MSEEVSSSLIHVHIFTSWVLRHDEAEASHLLRVSSEFLTHKMFFDASFLFLLLEKIERQDS